jgi:ribonuclease J
MIQQKSESRKTNSGRYTQRRPSGPMNTRPQQQTSSSSHTRADSRGNNHGNQINKNYVSTNNAQRKTNASVNNSNSPHKGKSTKRFQKDQKRRWLKPVVRRVRILAETLRKERAQETGDKTGGLRIIHLGGLGEVGRNMSAIQYDNEIIIIDAGVRFGDEKMPGIDFIIPNTDYLKDKQDMIKAMFFTHGHLDHIGAFPFIRNRIGDPDIYAAPLTKAILLKRQDDYKDQEIPKINLIHSGDVIKVSQNISVKALRINHSIPDDLAYVISTPAGKIIHTSDYKFDDTPVNDKPADIDEMKRLGDEGVLVLMSDSTGAENEGHSLSEQDITKNLDKLIGEATGMLILGTFASLINRIQQIITMSEKHGRKVVFDGYSMKSNVEICKKLGYLKMNQGTQIGLDQIDDYPREKITAVVTGAQGEGNAALMRIANGEHRSIRIHKNDTLVFSSSVIPGNEKDVQFLKDQLYRNGAKVYNYKMMDIHAGGHGNKEDLRKMIKLIRPQYLMPIHGQYSMMINHGLMGQEEGIPEKDIIIADNGSIVHVSKEGWSFNSKKALSDYVFVDGLGIGDVGNVVLRDRQVLSEDGFLVLVALIGSSDGKVKSSPDIISRGFIYLKDNRDLLMQMRKKIRYIIEGHKHNNNEHNFSYLKDQIRNQIGLFLFQKTQRRPMILPVLIEV